MPLLAKVDIDLICGRTDALWHSFRGQQIFITGGTGFFGRWLLESFTAANQRFDLHARATVLTRDPLRFRAACPHLATDRSLTLLQGDVQNFVFPDGEFAFVIHAAADVSAARGRSDTNDLTLLTSLFDGTRRVLDFAASHGARRFLMVSSGAVYGPQPASMTHIAETYTGAPDSCQASSAYGEGKRASEALCAAYNSASGLACTIARPFAFIGPHLDLDSGFAIGDFIRSAISSTPIRIRGDGTTMRSYLYAADLTIWLWTILVGGAPLRPYNVGSDCAISVRALAEEVAALLCLGLPIQVEQDPIAGTPPLQYVPSVRRSAEELCLVQTVSLQDAIRRTAEWHGWQNTRAYGVAATNEGALL